MKIKIFASVIILLILGRNEINAQEVKAFASLDTNNLLIGDQTVLQLKLTVPKGTKVKWPLLNDTIISNVEILSRSKIDSSFDKKEKNALLTQNLEITVFDSGYYPIPPFIFIYQLPDDTINYISETEPLLLSVYSVDVDTTQSFKPIKAPLKVPITFLEFLPYILIYVLLGVLIPGWYYFRKRKKVTESIIVRKSKVPPHVLALESLERLRKEKLWQSGRIKEYHSILTEIIRIYIEDRFNIPAIELTTNEILESFRQIQIEEILKEKLKYILELADLVKFAKAQPLPDEHADCMDKSVEFIRNTIPVVQPTGIESDADDEKKEMVESGQIERKV